ncbi:ribosyldihydronicotinamide dehydrogenase [quinone] isoform X1 [Heliangelus exortis]|uniref:ribosyldihydronicotinamide dehydrogenase [quinone] isoform X1 n=1 Tax=Heliangelus exortis TaxID=472823 RepID=UPI003A901995
MEGYPSMSLPSFPPAVLRGFEFRFSGEKLLSASRRWQFFAAWKTHHRKMKNQAPAPQTVLYQPPILKGFLRNSSEFNYGVEAWEAYKRGSLSKDLIEEQKKVQEADLLIFQFPLYWFSMPAIMKGWMDRVLVQGFAHEFPNCYDSGLLKNKLALFSFTTGGSEEMYAKGGISGDIRYLLWPMQHGIMHFCGVKVLAPHICFAPEYVSEEKRKEMLIAWAQRLKTLWKEEPINCSPDWYFK